jgi:hypothetical protein
MSEVIVIPALSATSLVAFVSLILSLALMYVPKLNAWFGALTSETKKAVFAGTALVVGALWFGMGFIAFPPEWGIVVHPVNVATFVSAVLGVVFGAGSVQGLYKLMYEPDAVTEVKALRDGAFLEAG